MNNPYVEAYRLSIDNPDSFWGQVAEECFWYRKWSKVLDNSNLPFPRWFQGG